MASEEANSGYPYPEHNERSSNFKYAVLFTYLQTS